MIAKAQEYGEIKYMINGAGVSPSQASIETILKVDLYGTAVLLEEVGKVIAEGGVGAFITGSTFLADGGATASYYYGPLQPCLETGMEEGKQ